MRDICATDEERMTAIEAHKYIETAFAGSEIKVGLVDMDPNVYRMIAAVNRAVKALQLLQPKSLNAHGKMAFVRNGLGADMYLNDEIILSKGGARNRIGNTDAEGRNVMVDLITDS
ncbi:unnamed protein product, partial [Dibothriocephalus latus]